MPSRGAETSSAFRPVALLAPKCSRNSERVSDSRLGSESAVTTPRTRAASSLRTWISRRTTPRRFRRVAGGVNPRINGGACETEDKGAIEGAWFVRGYGDSERRIVEVIVGVIIVGGAVVLAVLVEQ